MNPNELIGQALAFLESSKDTQIADARANLIKHLDSLQEDAGAYNFALVKVAHFLVNCKELDSVEKMQAYEQVMMHLLTVTVRARFTVGVQALRQLLDSNAEYYKYNMLDRNLDFPIGRNNPLPRYQPQVNEECDVVKPYITTTSPCTWVRCTVLSISNNGVYIIRYGNSIESTTLKDTPFFAPLGTRCKDYDWRMSLKPGDMLDAQDSKTIWYYSTIAEESVENGVKKVRVTFREFTEEGDKIDSDNRRYHGWGANQDEWLDVMSPRIRLPHTMHKRLCYYSSASNSEFFMDDSFDILYLEDYKQKPFYAMLRSSCCKSQTLITLFDSFVRMGGLQIYQELLTNNSPNIDLICHLSIVVAYTWFLPPKMAIESLHRDIIDLVTNYIRNNSKNLTAQKLQATSYVIEALSRRLLTLTQKHDYLEQLRRDLILQLIPMNLEKQLIAMRLIHELMKPQRPYSPEGKAHFIRYLKDNDIFRKVLNSNTHDQVLTRSTQLLKFLLDNNVLDQNDIDYLWKIYPMSDFRGRAVLEKIIGDVVPQMRHEQVEMLIKRIIEIRETDITTDNLVLLRALKNKLYSKECILNTLKFLWNLLTIKSANVKVSVEEQVEKVFKGFITTVTDFDIKFQLLKDMVSRLKEIKTIKGEPNLLKEYLMTYKDKRLDEENTTVPVTLNEALHYLISQDIYSVVLGLLSNQKSDDKIKQLLEFMKYLMSNDSQSDLSPILKRVYEKLGPAEHVLNWLKDIGCRSPSFMQWFFQENVGQAEAFKGLSLDGFKAVQSLFIDLNEHLKKVSYYKGKLTIEPKSTSTTTEQKDSIEIEYTTKRDFVYVLCNPTQLSGLAFLESLLEFVTSQLVHGKIIEFIITLMVSLDDSLLSRTIEIRTSIINMIVDHIRAVQAQKELTDKVKHKLLRNLNLLNQLMIETEINGLFDISPHFESMQAEGITLKFENAVTNSKAPKEFQLQVADNITLWKLKQIICEKLNENPLKITLYKAKKMLQKRQNGKSLREISLSTLETIKVETANVQQLPKCRLLDETTGNATQKLEKVISKWFRLFHRVVDNVEVMNFEDVFRFFKEHTRNPVTEEQALQIVTNFGKDLNLTYEQFKQYMINRTKENINDMWRFLNLSGYRNDLRYKDELDFILPVESLARQILSNDDVYNLLFQTLQNPVLKPVHSDLYKFLCALSTNPRIKNQIFGESFNPTLFNTVTSVYHLSYLTTIVMNSLRTPQIVYQFAERGGLECICQKLESFGFDTTGNVYEIEDKTMIANMLKMLSCYCCLSLISDPLVFSLSDQKLNSLELPEFIEVLNKKIREPPKEAIQKMAEFINRVSLDLERTSKVAHVVFKNMIINYKSNYSRQLTIEVSKLMTILSRFHQPDIAMLLDGLIMESLNLRRACMNILFLQSRVDKRHMKNLIEKLLQMMPAEENKTNVYSNYFELISKLLQEHSKSEENKQIDYSELCGRLFKKIMEHKSTERRNVLYTKDIILNGYLQILVTILSTHPSLCQAYSYMKRDIVNRCLFFENPRRKIETIQLTKDSLTSEKQLPFFEDYVVCKTQSNRKLAMQIVSLLFKANPEDSSFIETLLSSIIESLPTKLRKPSTKDSIVGIYNMGCICYINAMLQMLNSVEPFRNGIMMTEVGPDKKIINELQRMMSYLYFSERQDYLPEEFLKGFTPAINPMIQQDTTEFLGMLFDCLENELKSTPYMSLLKSIFQGTTVVQMLCHSCGKKRERKQQFFYYTVGVKDKNNLEQALEGMHMGEVINDCLCEECGVKGDFTKRSVLGDTPNVMIIHLQRIIFNLDVFMNTKIHTRLPFPLQLNLEPYTKEGVELRENLGIEYLKKLSENEQESKKFKEMTLHGRNEKDYMMNLKAIIVHSGSADVGHYYTIVKQDARWIKLDDSRASVFTQSNFDSECYGGVFTAGDEWAHLGEQSKNAYVLIYQKEVKNLIKLEAQGTNLQYELSKFGDTDKPVDRMVNYSNFKTYNLKKFYREVWLENHQLMLETHLFGENYSKDFANFLEQILSVCKSDKKAQMVSDVLFRLSTNSGEVGRLIEVFESCKVGIDIYNMYLKQPKKIWDMLFHNEKSIRTAMARYIFHVFDGALKQNIDESIGFVETIIDSLLALLNADIAKNWNKCQGFFNFMLSMVNLSMSIPRLYQFILSKHLIAQYVDFIMEKESPIKLAHKRYQMGNKFVAVEFSAAIDTILQLLQRSYLFWGTNVQKEKPPQQMLYHLNRDEVLALSYMNFYTKMIKEKQAVESLGWIIHRLSIMNLKFSEEISRVILRCLNETMDRSEEIPGIMFIVRRLIEIKDDFKLQRMQFLLGYGKTYMSKTYKLDAIDQDIYVYTSTIEDIFPIECILNYLYTTRINNQMSALYVIKDLLDMMNNHDWVGRYMSLQPATNNTYRFFYEWIKPYLLNVNAVLSQQKVDQAKVDKIIKQSLQSYEQYEKWVQANISSTQQPIITGQVMIRTQKDKIKVLDQEVWYWVQELEVYCTKSEPVFEHTSNLALSGLTTNGRLENKNIDPESSVLYFMQPRDAPIALRNDDKAMKIEGPEPSHIEPLFCEVPDPPIQSVTHEKMELEEQQPIKPVESKPFEPPVRLDVKDVFVCDYYRQILVENKCDVNKFITVEFDNSMTSETSNCLLPSRVSEVIRSQDRETMIVLNKLDYRKPWGPIAMKVIVEDGDKWKKPKLTPANYKIYGDVERTVEEPIQQAETVATPPVDTHKIQTELTHLKQCAICTVFNPLDATKCECCDTEF